MSAGRQVTPQAIRADIREIGREISELEAQRKTLMSMLSKMAGDTAGTTRVMKHAKNADYAGLIYNALFGAGEMTATEIADRAEVSTSTVSRVLPELIAAGKVRRVSPAGQRRNVKFERTEVRIRPGESVE